MTRHPGAPVAFAVALAGIALFTAMDALMKGLTLALGVYNALLWRSVMGTVISGALFASRGRMPSRAAMRVHVIRGLVSVTTALLFFWGLARVPMAQTIALSFVAPIIALFLAGLVLKERISPRSIFAALIAFGGVIIILLAQARGSVGSGDPLGGLAILVSAICYAWNVVLMRQQSLLAAPDEATFFQSLIPALALVCASPWLAIVPSYEHALPIIGAAVLMVGSLLALSWAYGRAEATYLVTAEYSAFIWAALLGYLVFGERLSIITMAGACLIVLGCLIAVRGRTEPAMAGLEPSAP